MIQAASHPTFHRTMKIGGLEIFYREAGDPKSPTVLLLHGFPSSSHMFRDLIPCLADHVHLVAPDYPRAGPLWVFAVQRASCELRHPIRQLRLYCLGDRAGNS